jgi:hypothetical protein
MLAETLNINPIENNEYPTETTPTTINKQQQATNNP